MHDVGTPGRCRRSGIIMLLLLSLLLSVVFPGQASPGGTELDGIVLSDFVILNEAGTGPPPADLHIGNRIRLTLKWSATPQYDYNLHEGDYFQFELPPELIATGFPGNLNFELKAEDGVQVVANGKITPKSPGGGTVRITFTDYVEGKAEVAGDMFIIANFRDIPDNVGPGKTFTITYGSNILVSDPGIDVGERPLEDLSQESFRKWAGVHMEPVGGVSTPIEDKVRWTIRINMNGQPLKDVVVTDQLQLTSGGNHIIIYPDSFTLQPILYELDPVTGAIIRTIKNGTVRPLTPSPSGPLTLNAAGDGFVYTLGDVETVRQAMGDAYANANPEYADLYVTYLLRYTSSYVPGERANNGGTGKHSEAGEVSIKSSYYAQEAGGGGTGDSASFVAIKRWSGGPLGDRPLAQLTLKQDGNPFTPPAGSLTLSKISDEIYQYRWSHLPVTNPATSEKYIYSAEEANVVGGQVTINGNHYAVTQDGSSITNTYVPPEPEDPVDPDPSYPTIRVPLTVKKLLKNGSLKAGSYSFQLKDSAGTVLETVSNDANGQVVFADRTFSRVVSNYHYTIHEVVGNDKRVTYDPTVYTVKVTTRAVNGKLEASVVIEKDGTPYAGEMTFVNTLSVPRTGDSAYRSVLLLLAASAVLLVAFYTISNRKRRGS